MRGHSRSPLPHGSGGMQKHTPFPTHTTRSPPGNRLPRAQQALRSPNQQRRGARNGVGGTGSAGGRLPDAANGARDSKGGGQVFGNEISASLDVSARLCPPQRSVREAPRWKRRVRKAPAPSSLSRSALSLGRVSAERLACPELWPFASLSRLRSVPPCKHAAPSSRGCPRQRRNPCLHSWCLLSMGH